MILSKLRHFLAYTFIFNVFSSVNLFFYKVHSPLVDLPLVTESLEESRELSLTRVFLVEFSPGAASSTQNCARFASTDKSSPDVELSQARAYPDRYRISKRTRKSILPECEKTFSAERVCRKRDHFDTREEIRDLSTFRSPL